MLKLKLNCQDLSNQVRSMMKTRHDNNVTNHIGAVNTENETELSWLIRSGAIYDKN